MSIPMPLRFPGFPGFFPGAFPALFQPIITKAKDEDYVDSRQTREKTKISCIMSP